MGTRRPPALVDTTPAKTILVYRNGDPFYVGRKVVLSRRGVTTFEALLEQLTEQVDVPFGVRRLYTPTRGHLVGHLDALQAGGRYVAAGRECFKTLDYIHIVPRKPPKMRKLKEIKPVVHCDINVPSRWQTYHRISRHINVFTNGRLYSPPIKIIIPKFSLSDWNSVLATIGEKVFPLGGVRKLFTMNGHLLDSSDDLQDNHFYVAAGLETFKHFPYWRSPRVPSDVQQRYAELEKCSQRKKKVDPKEKDSSKGNNTLPRAQDSVYYAKEGKKKILLEPLVESGAEGDVYKAPKPAKDVQGALDVKEDPEVQVDVPVDQTLPLTGFPMCRRHPLRPYSTCHRTFIWAMTKYQDDGVSATCLQVPAEIITEDDNTRDNAPYFEGSEGDNSRVSFKKRFPLRHNTKKKEKRFIKWILQILKSEGGLGVPLEKYVWAPEHHLVTHWETQEKRVTDDLPCPWRQRSQMREQTLRYRMMLRTTSRCRGQQAPSLRPRDLAVALDLLSRGCVGTGQLQGPHVLVASLENLYKNTKVVLLPEKEQYGILERKNTPVLPETPVEIEAQREPPVRHQSQKASSPRQGQRPEQPESAEPPSLEQPSQEQRPKKAEPPDLPSLRQPSQEQRPQQQDSAESVSSERPCQQQRPEQSESLELSSSGQPLEEQRAEKPECPDLPKEPSQEQRSESSEPQAQRSEQPESPKPSTLGQPSPEQGSEKPENPEPSSLERPSQGQISE